LRIADCGLKSFQITFSAFCDFRLPIEIQEIRIPHYLHMVLLKISYKLRAHHVAEYDRAFAERTLPLIREHGFKFWGIWRSVVGDAQEYLELWEFDCLAEFDEKWRKLASDPRLQDIFKVTGPMVEDERLTLFEPSLPGETAPQ
jgi:NIPSNAP